MSCPHTKFRTNGSCFYCRKPATRIVPELKQRIAELEAKCDQQDDVLQKIRSWCEAYPLDIFPEPTKEEWQEIHSTLKRELGIPLDRIAASNMRHVINGVAALLPGGDE